MLEQEWWVCANTHISTQSDTHCVYVGGALSLMCVSLSHRERERERAVFEMWVIHDNAWSFCVDRFYFHMIPLTHLLPPAFITLCWSFIKYMLISQIDFNFFSTNTHTEHAPHTPFRSIHVSPMSDWHSLLRSRRLLFLSSSIKVCFFNLYYFILLWRCSFLYSVSFDTHA